MFVTRADDGKPARADRRGIKGVSQATQAPPADRVAIVTKRHLSSTWPLKGQPPTRPLHGCAPSLRKQRRWQGAAWALPPWACHSGLAPWAPAAFSRSKEKLPESSTALGPIQVAEW